MFFGNAVESAMQSCLFATHFFFDVGGSLHEPIRPSLKNNSGPTRIAVSKTVKWTTELRTPAHAPLELSHYFTTPIPRSRARKNLGVQCWIDITGQALSVKTLR